jgi:hypothetical protein
MVMRRLTLEGVSPADAAKIALATAVPETGQEMHTPAEGYDLSSAATGPGSEFTSYPRTADGQGADYQGKDNFQGEADYQGEDDADGEFESPPRPQSRPGSAQRAGLAQQAWPQSREVLDEDPDEDPSDEAAGDPDDSDHPSVEWSGVLRAVPLERRTPGGGRVVAMPDGTPQSRGLARAAMSLDTYEMNRILRDMIRREGAVSTWDNMIMPVLRALGERIRVTGDGIDVEHAFSEVILGVMRQVAMNLPAPGKSPVVLLACADSDNHSLPLHALAAALAERGIPTRMLGPSLPPHALSSSVRRTGPSVIVLFARMSGADAADTEALRRQRPAPTVILAGPGWIPETVPSTARTATSLIGAVDEVLRVVHA